MKKRDIKLQVAVLLVLLLVSGCSPLVQKHNSASQDPELRSDVYITVDGSRLPVKTWKPEHGANAVIIALHGFNDYSNGMAMAAEHFKERGIVTIAYDQRGFGNTANRGIWPGTGLLSSDLIEFIKLVKIAYPDLPVSVMGVSMGASVVLSAIVKDSSAHIESVILVAPAVWGGESFNNFYRSMLWLGVHLFPWNYVTARSFVTFSDNTQMIKQFRADPLVISKTRLDAVYGMRNLMDHTHDIAAQVKMPLHIYYGLKDEVIPMAALCEFLSRLETPYKLNLYPGGYHFLLRDLGAGEVRGDIADLVLADSSLNVSSTARISESVPPEQCLE